MLIKFIKSKIIWIFFIFFFSILLVTMFYKLLRLEDNIELLSFNNRFMMEQIIGIENLKQKNFHLENHHKIQLEKLKKTDIFLKKYEINYWLDFGTLLGAIRHKGFIPWDDDIDIGMMRKDYEKLRNILLNNSNLIEYSITKYDRICLNDIDVYAYDFVNKKDISVVNFRRNLRIKLIFRILPSAIINKFIKQTWQKYYIEDSDIMIPGSEYYLHNNWKRIIKKSDIFPLQDVKFENLIFKAPNRYHEYLTDIYGKYMSFPRSFGKK